MSNSSSLKTIHAETRTAALEKENRSLKEQLGSAIKQLESARQARRFKLPVHKPQPRLRSDIVRICIPDTHGAKADKRALAALLSDVKALQPQEIILLGDHVDCGGFLAQHHTMGYVAETEYSYEDDILAAASFLDALRVAAPNAKIEYLEGNHEDRVEAWCITQTLRHRKDSDFLRRQWAPSSLLKLAEREIAYYSRGKCYDDLTVPGVIKRGKCYFLHGFTASRHAVAATQLKTAGNVVSAHTHRSQSEVTRRISTGVIGSWNPGCLCELQPLWQHGNPTEWTHGYAVQLVSHSDAFLHINIPVVEGVSLMTALMNQT